MPVSNLWECKEGSVVYKFSQTDIPMDVIEEVYEFTHHERLSSHVFKRMFERKKKEYLSVNKAKTLTLQTIITDLWKPLCSVFKEDIAKLHDGLQLPLPKVTFLFGDISDHKVLNDEISKWCDAAGQAEKGWIREASQKILDYQELCRYSYAAQTLMGLKETLGLTGDFSSVEALVTNKV